MLPEGSLAEMFLPYAKKTEIDATGWNVICLQVILSDSEEVRKANYSDSNNSLRSHFK